MQLSMHTAVFCAAALYSCFSCMAKCACVSICVCWTQPNTVTLITTNSLIEQSNKTWRQSISSMYIYIYIQNGKYAVCIANACMCIALPCMHLALVL